MTTTSTIRKIGNSAGVILDKDSLHAAGLSEGDRVEVSVEADGSLRLTPAVARDAFAMRVGRQFLKDHRGAFEALRNR